MAKTNKNNGGIIAVKKPVNFKLDNVTFEKVKDLAYLTGVPQVEIYNRSIMSYIKRYEDKNGAIPPRPLASGLDDI